MIFTPDQDKVLSLAGLFQSGKLVTQLSTEPEHDRAALRISATSLLVMHPENMEEIFHGVSGLRLGLETMAGLLRARGVQSMMARELIRYMMSMDQLADRLQNSTATQTIVEKGLYELNFNFSRLAERDANADVDAEMEQEYDALYANIGTLYQKSLSKLEPKIIVRGAKGFLQDEASVARVRTALFAGVRAAFLWHQQGARRWHLIFSRRSYAEMASQMLRTG